MWNTATRKGDNIENVMQTLYGPGDTLVDPEFKNNYNDAVNNKPTCQFWRTEAGKVQGIADKESHSFTIQEESAAMEIDLKT